MTQAKCLSLPGSALTVPMGDEGVGSLSLGGEIKEIAMHEARNDNE